MQDDLERKVDEHGQRMMVLESHSAEIMALNMKNTEQFASLIGEIHDLTTVFKVYAEKHDNLKESNTKLWAKVEKQDDSIDKINLSLAENKKLSSIVEKQGEILQKIATTNATNQVAINTFVLMKNKALALVVAAILSPIALGVSLIFTK